MHIIAEDMNEFKKYTRCVFVLWVIRSLANLTCSIYLLSMADTGRLQHTRFKDHVRNPFFAAYLWADVLYLNPDGSRNRDSMTNESIYILLVVMAVFEVVFVVMVRCVLPIFSVIYQQCENDVSSPEENQLTENEENSEEARDLRSRTAVCCVQNQKRATMAYTGVHISIIVLAVVSWILISPIYTSTKNTVATLIHLIAAFILVIQSIHLMTQVLDAASTVETPTPESNNPCDSINRFLLKWSPSFESLCLCVVVVVSILYQHDSDLFTESQNRTMVWSGNKHVGFGVLAFGFFVIAFIMSILAWANLPTQRHDYIHLGPLTPNSRYAKFFALLILGMFYFSVCYALVQQFNFLRHVIPKDTQALSEFKCKPSDSSVAHAFWLDRYPDTYPGISNGIAVCQSMGFSNIACGEHSYTTEVLVKLLASYLMLSSIANLAHCILWLYENLEVFVSIHTPRSTNI